MSEAFVFTDFDFSQSVRDIETGCLLKPVLHNYLFDAKFPAFTLHFEKQEMERAPDAWFHPSTHPLWSVPALFRYMAYPDTFPVEKKQYMSTLSVMFGKITHEFVQMCLTDAGVLPAAMQVCTSCPPEAQCREPGFVLEKTRDRGHVDGLLDLSSLGPSLKPDQVQPIFEFKTTNDNFNKLTKMVDLDLEAFKKKWPEYWAQQQRYQHMSGRRLSIVLMMEMGYPWLMKEFHIPYDAAFNQEIDRKYLDVLAAVEASREVFCCRMKGCKAAALCGV